MVAVGFGRVLVWKRGSEEGLKREEVVVVVVEEERGERFGDGAAMGEG